MLRIETHPTVPPRGLLTATVREDLGQSSPSDRRIERSVEDATAAGEGVSPGKWVYRDYFERITLNRSTQRLYLQARPIQEVTSVFLDGEEFVEGDGDFEVFPSFLYREDGWRSVAGRLFSPSTIGHDLRPAWEIRYFGGYWLKASMGDTPAGVESIDVEGIHLRRALQEVVRDSWFQGHRNPGNCDKDVPKRSDGPVGIVVPPTALAVFRQEGSLAI